MSDLIFNLRVRTLDEIKDPQLHKAMKVIFKIANQNNASVDIFNTNVMWRLTRGGPQLVIVDPLFAGWHTVHQSPPQQNFY